MAVLNLVRKGGKVLCSLFVLSFVASLINLSTPSSVNAWTGQLNGCTETLPSNWVSQIKQEGGSNFYSDIDFKTQMIVMGKSSAFGSNYIHVSVTGMDSGSGFKTVSGQNTYQSYNTYGSEIVFDLNPASSDPMFFMNTSSSVIDFTCIVGVQNEDYLPSYVGQDYSQSLPFSEETCATTDVFCHLGKFGDNVTSGIAFLFIPDSDDIMASFNTLKDSFETQFGMLAQPVIFIIDLITAMTGLGVEAQCYIPIEGTYFGANPHLSLCSVEETNQQMFNTVIGLVRTITVFSLIIGIYFRYQSIVKGYELGRR